MTSICNYSHPELQISEGLVRHNTGSLFPYNPEFYQLASGLYGPGAIYCWELLLLSVILNWSYYPKDDNGCRRPSVSTDLLAVVAYPAFAATDILVHAMKLLGTEYRALALFCLRFPSVELTYMGTFNHTQLDLRNIPPEILSLGQHAIDLTGPLTVCYSATLVFFWLILLFTFDIDEPGLCQTTPWVGRLVNFTYGYTVLVLVIFHLSLDNLGISIILAFYEGMMPVFLILGLGLYVFMAGSFLLSIFCLVLSIWKSDKKNILKSLQFLGYLVILATFTLVPVIIATHLNGITFVPDLGIKLSERDQLAALIGGITTLGFTLSELWHRFVGTQHTEGGDAEESQTLTSDV